LARYQAGIRTEARIIAATRELLSEVGLDGTTLKAICDRAGVRAGSFYNLFDSKESAILRVVKDAINAVDPHPRQDAPDSVEELVEAYIAFIIGQPDVARVYLKIAISGASNDGSVFERVRRHEQRRTARLAAALSRQHPALSAAEATAHSEVMLATLSGLAFRWMLEPGFDFAARARLAIRTSPVGG